MAEVKSHKVKQLSSRLDPNAIYWVQASANLPIEGFITDIQGVPYPLKDISGSGGITGLVNTDGNLVITGADNKVINLAPALLSLVNSALQSGANISELLNDAGYITSADLPTKTSDLINDGSDATSTYVEADELGAVAFSNDYNDLDNKPTIPTVITNHSGLSLDDGANPHGTTKGDVGLGNVPNVDTSITSNISEGSNLYFTTVRVLATVLSGLSLATGGAIVSTDSILVAFGKIQKQIDDLTTSIGNKLDKVSTSGVERAYIINADGSQGTKATSELKDVLEFVNLASFPVTGETGKIYLALDANKTYRWSGSAYVQIGGGTEVDIFNPYTSDYFIGTIRPSGASFILSGFNNSWSVSGTLEAFSEVSEYTLVGVKSATTSGASCQFYQNTPIRTYPVNRINKVIQWQIFRNSDPAPVANARFFVGIINKFALIGNTNPSTNFNLIGVGADSGDTNIQVIHNDLSGVATKIDLGSNFPANTQNVDTYLSQTFFDIPNAKAYIRLVRLNTGHEVIKEITTNLPGMSGGWDLTPVFWRNNGTDALEVKMRIGSYLQGQKMV